MRILITNDDGINAPGLAVLAEIAAGIAGPEGEVWTVAPAFEQSGVAHAISYTHPTMIAQMDARRFAAEGSPADCVLAGIFDVMTDGDFVPLGTEIVVVSVRGNRIVVRAAKEGDEG